MTNKILKDCYLRIAFGDETKRKKIEKTAVALGATIGRWNSWHEATLIIWDKGTPTQWKEAQNSDLRIVSPSWIEACQKEGRKVPARQYEVTEFDGAGSDSSTTDEPKAKKPAKIQEKKPEPDSKGKTSNSTDDHDSKSKSKPAEKATPKKETAREKAAKEKEKEAKPEKESKPEKEKAVAKDTPSKEKKETAKQKAAREKAEKEAKEAEERIEKPSPKKGKKEATKETKKDSEKSKETKNKKKDAMSVEEKKKSKKASEDEIKETKKRKRKSDASEQSSPAKKRKTTVSKYIVFSQIPEESATALKSAIKKLGDAELQSRVTSKTTHVVLGAEGRTEKVFWALARGIPIVKRQWIEKSFEKREWLKESDYEATEWIPGCRSARKAKDSGNLLFKGQKFYVGANPPNFTRDDLVAMIELSGGQVSSSSHFQLGDDTFTIAGARGPWSAPQLVNVLWLLDALSSQSIPDHKLEKYVPEKPVKEKAAPSPKKPRKPREPKDPNAPKNEAKSPKEKKPPKSKKAADKSKESKEETKISKSSKEKESEASVSGSEGVGVSGDLMSVETGNAKSTNNDSSQDLGADSF